MTFDQIILFAIIATVLGMLVWGRIRYDIVAFCALVIGVLTGVVPQERAFSGFGHEATIIIALVLIISRGLANSGAIDMIACHLINSTRRLSAHIAIMSAIAAALSAIMNNVAALALLMPVDIQAAAKAKRSPAFSLMPLSFASILGGMVTLIGTPPNIVIATFRENAFGHAFTMFDFTPVGAAVALIGVVFVALAGWRLIPQERTKRDTTRELSHLGDYIAEAGIVKDSAAIGQTVGDLYAQAEEADVRIIGLIRRGKRLAGYARDEVIGEGDRLVLEAGPEGIEAFSGAIGLKYAGTKKHDGLLGESLSLLEAVVPQGARIAGRSARDLRLQYRRGVTLLGVSRRGKRSRERIDRLTILPGDILLLLGPEALLHDVALWLGCLPLAGRGLHVAQRQKAWAAVGLFAASIILASTGLVFLPAALGGCVVAYALLRIVPPRQLYDAVEWPVIVLLGSLIPLAAALETSGGADLITEGIVAVTTGLPAAGVLVILMVVTMALSDILNNVATALIAAPVAIDLAGRLHVNPDPFLMAVAVAASCAFMTPVGHKNNTIILGPGGYRFGDYWRMGLPLESLVLLVAVPTILIVWPL